MKQLWQEFLHAVWLVIKLPILIVIRIFRYWYNKGWKSLVLFITAAIVVTIVFMFSFLEATSQPGFCSNCHIMRPYIDAWETSAHADVHCMTCHAGMGVKGYLETKMTAVSMLANYFTGIYKRSRPWAEIEDANCLQGGCHDTRLLEGKVEFTSGVIFDHTPHLTESRRGKKLRCTSCHSQIVQGEHISVTSSTCFLCHFKNVSEIGREELSNCTKCHVPPSGDEAINSNRYDHAEILLNEVDCKSCHKMMWQGTGIVLEERCGVCHSETAHIDKIDDLEFIHEWHIEKRKIDCQACHSSIEHQNSKPEMALSGDCFNCHDQKHTPMLDIYNGTLSKLIDDDMPDIMFENGITCMSCHSSADHSYSSDQANNATCTPCHDASYLGLAQMWKEAFSQRIARMEKEITNLKPHPRKEDAIHDLTALRDGGAWHNPKYSEEILNRVEEVIAETKGRTFVPPQTNDDSKRCLNCHSGILELKADLPWSDFSHSSHIVDRSLSCNQCHIDVTPEKSSHGKLKDVKNSCNSCHHSPESIDGDNCSPCHQPSSKVYTGELPGYANLPSQMYESEMACIDCHDTDSGIVAPEDQFCLDCHDQDVVDNLILIRSEFNLQLKQNAARSSEAGRIILLDEGRAVHHPDLTKQVLKTKTH
jgi:nitrate/TMAO reductase-like tetraheme cytochrome c subunit